MDFARKQLEKYGWSDGKGLGKHENGISEALKPKLKRSVAGIGHDAAADFTEHWWSDLYNKASSNLEVQEKNGKTKKIKPKEEFEITNSTWKLKRKHKANAEKAQYGDFFVKKAILTNGGSKTKKVDEAQSDEEETFHTDTLTMTDEELFAACEGRTAHKGARHGLKALGKLARIELQEKMLLCQAKYDGYSHKNKVPSINDLQIVEDMNLNSDGDGKVKTRKKKKKKCRQREEDIKLHHENIDAPKMSKADVGLDNDNAEPEVSMPKKSKKKRKLSEGNLENPETEELQDVHKKSNNKRDTNNHESTVEDAVVKSKKKRQKVLL